MRIVPFGSSGSFWVHFGSSGMPAVPAVPATIIMSGPGRSGRVERNCRTAWHGRAGRDGGGMLAGYQRMEYCWIEVCQDTQYIFWGRRTIDFMELSIPRH